MSTDRYEFTMSNGYFEEGMKDQIAYFDVFFRRNPLQNGYTIMAGLDQIIRDVKNMHFEKEDIEYFENQGVYSKEFLEYLRNFKFTGDIYAIPDGTPFQQRFFSSDCSQKNCIRSKKTSYGIWKQKNAY